MPVTISAEKKVRKDKVRTKQNKKRVEKVKKLIKEAKIKPDAKNIQAAQSSIDKLAKVGIIHKNKAARLKSQVARFGRKETKLIRAKESVKKVKSKISKAKSTTQK